MGSIKDKALKSKKNEESKFTLDELQIDVLMQYRAVTQQMLDQTLQRLTSVYLHSLAVDKFGYAPNCNLEFKLELEKSEDNFTVINIGS